MSKIKKYNWKYIVWVGGTGSYNETHEEAKEEYFEFIRRKYKKVRIEEIKQIDQLKTIEVK